MPRAVLSKLSLSPTSCVVTFSGGLRYLQPRATITRLTPLGVVEGVVSSMPRYSLDISSTVACSAAIS